MEQLNEQTSVGMRLKYIEAFEEGTELGDLVGSLERSASMLMGIGTDEELETVLKIAEHHIISYYQYLVDYNEFFELEEIDGDVFYFFMGFEKPKQEQKKTNGIPENEG